MIISNSRKFIFIHLHKCAGSSIEQTLDPFLRWDDIILGSTEYGERIQSHYKKRFFLDKHSTAQECFDVVGDDVWDAYYKFATIRNPYSLVVSTFTFAKKILDDAIKSGKFSIEDIKEYREKGLISDKGELAWPIIKGIIDSGYPKPLFEAYLKSSHTWRDLALKPQYEKLLVVRDNIKSINLQSIVKIEDLNQKWPELCQKLGISEKLSYSNVSSRKNWRDYYKSQESITMVNEKLGVDFEAFGYEKLELSKIKKFKKYLKSITF